MNPFGRREFYCPMKCKYKFYQNQILEKKSFSLHIIPKTKGLEKSLSFENISFQCEGALIIYRPTITPETKLLNANCKTL